MLYQDENPHGGDIYGGRIRLDYSANTNPFGTPEGVIRAIEAVLPQASHYPDPYCRKLVQAIAAHEEVPAQYILCGSGAAELIYSFCLAVKPRSAAELAPTFSEYSLGLEQVGCVPRRFALDPARDFLLGDELIPWLTAEPTEVFFLCSPNNPTGRTISRPLLEKILAACAEAGTRVCLDECFLDLTDHPDSMTDCLKDYPNLIILKAFTKSYGMAGIRLGYCLTSDPQLLSRMSRTVQPWNISIPAQAAGAAALSETAFLQKTREMIPRERQRLAAGLQRQGFRVIPSEANYILFQAPAELGAQLLRRGIAVRNCANYHGLEAGWYRIAVRLPEENEELLDTLSRVKMEECTWQ